MTLDITAILARADASRDAPLGPIVRVADTLAADVRALVAEVERLAKLYERERATASVAIHSAAVGEWVMAAIRGKPVSDFAESYAEVREAKELHAAIAYGRDAIQTAIDGERAALSRAEAAEREVAFAVGQLRHLYANSVPSRAMVGPVVEMLERRLDALRAARGDKEGT